MIRPMTKRAALQFVRCGKAVNDFEREELRSTPPAEKFRQLQALMHSAIALGWDDDDSEATAAVRNRWNRLRELYRAWRAGACPPASGVEGFARVAGEKQGSRCSHWVRNGNGHGNGNGKWGQALVICL